MFFNKKSLFFLLFSLLFLFISIPTASAQRKKLTYKQVYQGSKPRLTGKLPRIQGWLDDTFYLELKKDPDEKKAKTKLLKVNAQTGEESVYFDYDVYKGHSSRPDSLHHLRKPD